MKHIVLGLLVVAVFVATSGSVQGSGHAAATPVEAVTILVSGGTPQGPARSGCSLGQRTYRDCPVTDRMRQRLEQGSQAAFGEPVSRGSGQDLSPRISVAEIERTGDVALVNAGFEGGVARVTLTYVVRGQGRTWLVDDSYCAGRPETTIYTQPNPIPPCDVAPASLPDTAGSPFQSRAWPAILSGLVALTLGAALRRRGYLTRRAG